MSIQSGSPRAGLRLASVLVASFAILAGQGSPAAAQSARGRTEIPEELRAFFVPPSDIVEGRSLAENMCAGCHGANGISTIAGVPHLAGQRAGYLYVELKAYRSGARGDSTMRNTVKFLNDDALLKVAAYFGSLDPPQPDVKSGSKARRDPVEAGKQAAAACAGCHGDKGITSIPGIPNLVGMDPKYIVAAVKAYRDGPRNDEMMKSILATLNEADLEDAALFYALQKPTRAQTPVAGDPAKGKVAAAACAGCHGEQGVSSSSANPSLAGQDAEYLAAAMNAYKSGTRSDETMKSQVASLDEAVIRDIAAFYANQQPQAPNVRKPLTTEEWAQRCDRCHGLNGNSVDPRFPALAAQRADYLVKVLNAYKTRARKSVEMAAMTEGLSDEDIQNLAGYYAGQKARAVLFMMLPGLTR